MYIVKKSNHNPIFSHQKENIFEAHSAFNMSVLKDGPYLYGVYRAESSMDRTRLPERLSTIGITHSEDGIHFQDRRQFISPTEDWEQCGCEDPRLTFFEGKYYTFYTALSGYPYNADNIKVAVAVSGALTDTNIKEKHLVTPFNAKAMALFPKRINGKVTVVLSVNTDRDNMQLSIAQVDNIENLWDESSVEFWNKWYKNLEMHSFNIRRDTKDHYEGGPVPIYTKDGWLFIHSYIQNYKGNSLERIFGIEALLLDHKDPLKIVARTEGPIIVPSEEYELIGPIENICFPTGSILKGKTLSIYYGVVDAKTCVADINLDDLLHTMTESSRDRHKFTRVSRAPVIVPDPNHEWESLATFNPGALALPRHACIAGNFEKPQSSIHA